MVMLVSKSVLPPTFAFGVTYVKETALTNEPLSAGDATSAITPYAIEKLPIDISKTHRSRRQDMPEIARACNTRRPSRAAYEFASTIATLVPM